MAEEGGKLAAQEERHKLAGEKVVEEFLAGELPTVHNSFAELAFLLRLFKTVSVSDKQKV